MIIQQQASHINPLRRGIQQIGTVASVAAVSASNNLAAVHNTMAFPKTFALLIGTAFLLQLATASSSSPIRPIADTSAKHFDKDIAAKEVEKDIDNFLAAYDNIRDDLNSIANEFDKTRVKDVGIRKLADWGIALSRVYELEGMKADNRILDRMRDCARMLLSTRKTQHSYVENAVMRGWPMYVNEADREPTFEAFNFGHIGVAISLTARALAMKGQHEKAARMVTPVLEALYDGFLTADPTKSKLDRDGRVVYVPRPASVMNKMRAARQIRATDHEPDCLDNPQAYNHGLMAARAAMAAWRAIHVIDWSEAEWTMVEWNRVQAKNQLDAFVEKNAQYLKDGLKRQPPTGGSKLDKYPGPEGTDWYQWKYRNYDMCPKAIGTFLDRPEDMAHATYETNFVVEVRQWAHEHQGEPDIIFDMADAHRMIVTFLNRVVADYKADGGERFACDVDGTTDKKSNGIGESWKQCGGSRRKEVRAAFAPSWLPLATAVRYDLEKNNQAHCDALRMTNTVMPLVMPGAEFDETNFDRLTVKFASEAIQAKYYWHYYEKGMKHLCN